MRWEAYMLIQALLIQYESRKFSKTHSIQTHFNLFIEAAILLEQN